MAPAFAPSYPDKFIKITDADGVTQYVSAQAQADQALHAYAARTRWTSSSRTCSRFSRR